MSDGGSQVSKPGGLPNGGVSAWMGPTAGCGVQPGLPAPPPPLGVEPVGEGRLVERDALLAGQGDLPAQLIGDHPGVHGRLAQHRGLRGAGQE